MLKKKPSRRTGFVYWNADQFAKLQTAPAAKLASRGRLTWRWLAFLLDANPAVGPIRDVIRGRLNDLPTVEAELKRLTKMLVTLSGMGVITLDPPPPASWVAATTPSVAGGALDATAQAVILQTTKRTPKAKNPRLAPWRLSPWAARRSQPEQKQPPRPPPRRLSPTTRSPPRLRPACKT